MFLTVFRWTFPREYLAEANKLDERELVPLLRKAPGFIERYLATTTEGNQATAVATVVFDSLESAQAFGAQIVPGRRDALTGPPEIIIQSPTVTRVTP